MDKAAIKRAYKESARPMGVYKISTSQSGKVYVGVSKDLRAIINRHQAELKFGSHRNRELQDIWKSQGETAFKFEIADLLEPKESSRAKLDEELQTLADLWVQKLESAGNTVVRI
jgi:hypothetical protein